MKIYISNIGKREFLVLEDSISIPVDMIKKINLNSMNGAASANSICIHTDNDQYYFSYEEADEVRDYLSEQKIGILKDQNINQL